MASQGGPEKHQPGTTVNRSQAAGGHRGRWAVRLRQRAGRVTGKFGLGVQNEAGQRLIEFFQENALVIANSLFQQHKRKL